MMLGSVLIAASATFIMGFSSSWNHAHFGVSKDSNVVRYHHHRRHINRVLLHSTVQDGVVTQYEDEQDEEEEEDDPNAIDPDELGIFGEEDFEAKFEYEWDPAVDLDPNMLDPELSHVATNPVDDEGIEIGWDPIYGPSNPLDTRTIVTPLDSYVIAAHTRNESMVARSFRDNTDANPEVTFNRHVTRVRKDMRRIETYRDPHLVDDYDVPKNVAKWYGYPEQLSFPKKDFMNNKFTAPEDKTDFTKLSPYRARKKAVELARAYNNEWLPEGVSAERQRKRRQIFVDLDIKVGSLRPGECDETIVRRIQPCLKVLGGCADLLEVYGENLTVFRFHYHGAMKNRKGMAAWTETMIRDCGVECTGVVFEIGGRGRDKLD